MDISKEVTNRQRMSEEIIAAIRSHGPRIASELLGALSPYLREGERAPDLQIFMGLMERWATETTSRMVAADEEHARELGEDAQARSRRDDSFTWSRQGTISLKESLSGLHGPEATEVLGLSGETPETPQALARVLASAENILERGQRLPPPLDPEGPAWTEAKLRSRLSALKQPLEETLAAIRAEEQQSKGTLTRKWKAMEQQMRAYRAAVSMMVGLARGAGDDELATRLRPEGGRPVRRAPETPPE